jgi:hypothetical protein
MWDRKYNSDTEWITIAECLNNIEQVFFSILARKIVKFPTEPNFTSLAQCSRSLSSEAKT